MSWRIIYIENSHKASLYLNNLKIEDGDETYVVPINDINTVIFNNYKIHITAQLLCKLSQANVCVIICEKNGLPEIVLNTLNGNYATFRNQELQINLPDDKKSELWKKIVQGKIQNQITILENNEGKSSLIKKLYQFKDSVKAKDASNREGLAAKLYFRGLFGRDFLRDRDSQDPINTALNYGYSLMRAMMSRSVAAKGFIPAWGVFHKNPYNHFNLVDDFLEVYRPIVDEWVLRNMPGEYFSRAKRLELIEHMSKKILFDNKKHQIMRSMDFFLDSVVNYMKTGDDTSLKIPGALVFEDDE
jgi:CRISPR-associated protein Cas1